MTPQTITLPPGAATYAIERERIADLTDAQLAEVEFGPWEHSVVCRAPTDEEWAKGSKALPCLRHADQLVRLDKKELVEVVEAMSDAQWDLLQKGLTEWGRNLLAMLAVVETAKGRLTIGLAAVVKREKAQRRSSAKTLDTRSRATGSSKRGGRPA